MIICMTEEVDLTMSGFVSLLRVDLDAMKTNHDDALTKKDAYDPILA